MLAGVCVSVREMAAQDSAYTDSTGQVDFPALPHGEWTFAIEHAEWGRRTEVVRCGSSPISLEYPPDSMISVRVPTEADAYPLTVVLRSEGGAIRREATRDRGTSPSGDTSIVFYPLPPGRYSVEATRSDGVEYPPAPVVIPKNGDIRYIDVFDPTHSMRIRGAVTIDGVPAAETVVQVQRQGRWKIRSSTDADGVLEFVHQTESGDALRFSIPERPRLGECFVVIASEEIRVDFRSDGAPWLHVFGRRGNPVSGAGVSFHCEDVAVTRTTDEGGRCSMHGLPAGTYTVFVRPLHLVIARGPFDDSSKPKFSLSLTGRDLDLRIPFAVTAIATEAEFGDTESQFSLVLAHEFGGEVHAVSFRLRLPQSVVVPEEGTMRLVGSLPPSPDLVRADDLDCAHPPEVWKVDVVEATRRVTVTVRSSDGELVNDVAVCAAPSVTTTDGAASEIMRRVHGAVRVPLGAGRFEFRCHSGITPARIWITAKGHGAAEVRPWELEEGATIVLDPGAAFTIRHHGMHSEARLVCASGMEYPLQLSGRAGFTTVSLGREDPFNQISVFPIPAEEVPEELVLRTHTGDLRYPAQGRFFDLTQPRTPTGRQGPR